MGDNKGIKNQWHISNFQFFSDNLVKVSFYIYTVPGGSVSLEMTSLGVLDWLSSCCIVALSPREVVELSWAVPFERQDEKIMHVLWFQFCTQAIVDSWETSECKGGGRYSAMQYSMVQCSTAPRPNVAFCSPSLLRLHIIRAKERERKDYIGIRW